MNCLCCNKDLGTDDSKTDKGWHRKCIRKFFGTTSLPEIDIDRCQLEKLAEETVKKGFTVPGVQKKLSLHLSKISNHDSRLTLVDYPTGYILKPSSEEYIGLPEAEFTTMKMAESLGISVVPCALIRSEKNKSFSYITKRIDRENGLLAMEDFCQILGRLTEDKYKGSYEQCGSVIMSYSSRPGIDAVEFFILMIFCFITGNSDMHLKNFSLIETAPGKREYILSDAYDLLPVNLIIPEDMEQTALTLCGKKSRFKRVHFLSLSSRLGISEKTANRLIDRLIGSVDKLYEIIDSSYMNDEMKSSYKLLIEQRCDILRCR